MTTRIYDFPDGYTNATAPTFGAGIGSGALEPFQEEIGSGDGVDATFTTTHIPFSANSLIVFVDGIQRDKTTHWTLTSNVVTFQAGSIPALGQKIYVYYFRQVSGGGGGGTALKVEYRTITAPEATAKAITLVATPATATEVVLNVAAGTPQFYGDDFTVSGTTLSWSGLGLDGVLAAGDKLVVQYIY